MKLSVELIEQMLSAKGTFRDEVFAQARKARREHFGDEIFAYGFNYFSTYCKNDCTFCQYRRSNHNVVRYRHTTEQVVSTAKSLAESGVHLIDLTMGEDALYLDNPEHFADLISRVREATELPVMISPGVVNEQDLQLYHEAGATWLALYQETFSREAYQSLRVSQDYDKRMRTKQMAVQHGLLVEEGVMTGWGDSTKIAAESIFQMNTAHPSQVRVMTFVPQADTPMQSTPAQNHDRELLMIAAMRILYPDMLIPASLDVEGPAGLKARLDAGANVITSLIPPASGVLGVARIQDIKDGGRTLQQILPTIHDAGLTVASHETYRLFLKKSQEANERSKDKNDGIPLLDHEKEKVGR